MAAAERPSATVRSTQQADHRAGLRPVLEDLSPSVQLQSTLGKVTQEGRVLIHDADDPEPLSTRTLRER